MNQSIASYTYTDRRPSHALRCCFENTAILRKPVIPTVLNKSTPPCGLCYRNDKGFDRRKWHAIGQSQLALRHVQAAKTNMLQRTCGCLTHVRDSACSAPPRRVHGMLPTCMPMPHATYRCVENDERVNIEPYQPIRLSKHSKESSHWPPPSGHRASVSLQRCASSFPSALEGSAHRRPPVGDRAASSSLSKDPRHTCSVRSRRYCANNGSSVRSDGVGGSLPSSANNDKSSEEIPFARITSSSSAREGATPPSVCTRDAAALHVGTTTANTNSNDTQSVTKAER